MRDGTTPDPGPDEDPVSGRSEAAPDPDDAPSPPARSEEPSSADSATSGRSGRKPMSERERRRLAAIFGEVLPDTTSDEREPGKPGRESDAWYRENRPPHHDR